MDGNEPWTDARLRVSLGTAAEKDPSLLDFFYALDFVAPAGYEFFSLPGEEFPAMLIKNAEDITLMNLFLLSKMPAPTFLRGHFKPGLHIQYPPCSVAAGGPAHRLERHLLFPGRLKVFPPAECIKVLTEDVKNPAPASGKLPSVTRHQALFFEGRLLSYASSQFQSRQFVEVGIETEPEFQGKGYGAQALSGLCAWILDQGKTPVYITAAENLASLALCRKVGFEYHGDFEELVLG